MTSRTRALALKKETLAELATDDLRAVAGGLSGPTCVSCLTVCGVCEHTFFCAGSEPLTQGILCPGIGPVPTLERCV